MTDTVVIYHGNCSDGFGAAVSAYQKFGESADYFPAIYNQPYPPDIDGKTVYILDFSYDYDTMLEIASKAYNVIVLDHHDTAMQTLNGLITSGIVGGEFDLSQSGAMMAWKYFNPGVEPPDLIKCIQDRDLWRFEIESTKAVSLALSSYPQDINIWRKFLEPDGFQKLLNEGHAVLRYADEKTQDAVKTAYEVEFGGYMVMCANVPWFMASDVGHELSKDRPFSITYYRDGDDVVVSLRAQRGSPIHVGEIAKNFNGGDHPGAAGFRLAANKPCPWKSKMGW